MNRVHAKPAPARTEAVTWRATRTDTASVALAAACLGLGGAAAVCGAAGWLPWTVTVPVQAAVTYVAFTPLHEAAHGNLGRRRRWVDAVVGTVAGWFYLAPLPVFRWAHLRHHAHVNDPVHDPDRFVASSSTLGAWLRCAAIVPHYYAHFLRALPHTPRLREQLPASVLSWLLMAALASGLWALGGPRALVLGWLLPTWLGATVVSYVFDHLPHHPHEATDRHGSTRFTHRVLGWLPGAHWLSLGQTHHPIHHLDPSLPWHQYRRAYEARREELVQLGVPEA